MQNLRFAAGIFALAAAGCLSSCSDTKSKSPDVTASIQHSLETAGLKDVSVSEDRDKGVVTLSGTTKSDGEKAQAETIAEGYQITDGPNDQGQMFQRPGKTSDYFPPPFPNDNAARSALGGNLSRLESAAAPRAHAACRNYFSRFVRDDR